MSSQKSSVPRNLTTMKLCLKISHKIQIEMELIFTKVKLITI